MATKKWMRMMFDTWSLGLEASAVIAARTAKIARGGKGAETEALRMISEKIDSGMELQRLALTGGLGTTAHGAARKTLTHYRRKVRANRRRLHKDAQS